MTRCPRAQRHATLLLPLLAAGCDWFGGGSPLTSSDSLLRYVPADTPYVLAATEAWPDEIAQIFSEQMESAALGMRFAFETAVAQMGAAGAPADIAAIDMLSELISPETLAESGITRESTFVLYGFGLLPVLRVTLADGHNMAGVLDRIEQLIESQGDAAIESGMVAGQSYRYIGDEDARFVVALLENEVVATVVPSGIADSLLQSVLGLELPRESIAASARLQRIADEYGFTSHLIGLLDIEAIAATFVEPQSGMNAMLLDLMGHDLEAVPTACRNEIPGLAGVAPTIVTGYTNVSATELAMNVVIELREDIAAGLATLPASVQGLGAATDALFSFGMSFDIPAARAFMSARLDAIENDPFECELLDDMQASLPDMRIALNAPLPPIVDTLHGFSATVDMGQFDFANLESLPSDMAASVLISTDDAPGLLALVSALDPQIAALDLPTDGQIVEIDLPFPLNDPSVNPFGEVFFVATETLLGIGLGENGEARLGELLAAPAGDASTFSSMTIDMGAYYGLMADVMENMPALDPEAPPEEIVTAMADMMRGMQDIFAKEFVSVRFTERGVETPIRLEFAQ